MPSFFPGRPHGNAPRHNFFINNKIGYRIGPRGAHTWQESAVELIENWHQKPGQSSDLTTTISDNATTLANTIANKNFMVTGTNAITADVALRVGGGIRATSHGSTNDSTIVAPHTATNETAWAQATWLSQKSVRFEARIVQSTSITAQTWWCGLKLTNTPVIATDANQIFFRFDTTSTLGATKLHLIHGRATVQVDDVLPITIAASTEYRLVIEIDSNRFPRIYVNGDDYTNLGSISGQTGPAALVTAISYIPYTGILQTGASAKFLDILPGYKIAAEPY